MEKLNLTFRSILAFFVAINFISTTVPQLKAQSNGCSAVTKGNAKKSYILRSSVMSNADKERILENYGVLTVPKGETERAKKVRADALRYRQSLIQAINENVKIWRKLHPKATKKEIAEHRTKIKGFIETFFQSEINKVRIAAKSWDWRTKISVGPVMDQGSYKDVKGQVRGCGSCWAFAATSAAEASLEISRERGINRQSIGTDEKTGLLLGMPAGMWFEFPRKSPFAQDLINCMPIKQENICNGGWHGTAFDFMVNQQGIPRTFLDGTPVIKEEGGQEIPYQRLYQPGVKSTCQPLGGFIKADSWDYVNSPPDRLPTVKQLKTALIEHGPLATGIVFDRCLAAYGGGVFDEKDLGDVNHAVLIVGWDDEKQAWLVKNSWGEDWGEKGFAWIKYGSNNIGLFAAWIDASLKHPYSG